MLVVVSTSKCNSNIDDDGAGAAIVAEGAALALVDIGGDVFVDAAAVVIVVVIVVIVVTVVAALVVVAVVVAVVAACTQGSTQCINYVWQLHVCYGVQSNRF